MVDHFRAFVKAVCLVGMLATTVLAADPTYSLEAISVNSVPLPDGPAGRIAVLPGDTITVEIYVRDWSPAGEDLSGYQVQMEPSTYTSGSVGFVEPVNYTESQESRTGNKENCFIETNHPRAAFAGYVQLPLEDHRSPGYRLASLVLRGEKGPISKQDGTKYYCGTIKLHASDNAQGTFVIALMEGPDQSGLRDSVGRPILPVQLEPLTVVVRPDISTLIGGLNGNNSVPDFQVDIDRDGTPGTADVLKVIGLLNAAG